MSFKILVGSYTREIYTLDFDPSISSLKLVATTTVGYHPSWITSHPGDRSTVFAGLEQSEGKVISLYFDEDGEGRIVGEASTGGEDPCSVLASAHELIAANYSSGSVAFFTLLSTAPYLKADSPVTIQLSGSGPNRERQETSHAHQVIYHPDREELLVPDLGADKVWRFLKAKNGKWEIRGHVSYSPGGGPRHVAFHDGILYTLIELTSSITAHRFPPLPSEPTLLHTTSTLARPIPQPNDMLAAEILVPKLSNSFPEPYLYVSNRNDPSPGGDTITIFSLADKERPKLIEEVATGLVHVRGIMFGGLDDRWLVAGGVHAGGVKVFERIEGGRKLRVVAENSSIEGATGFLWV